MAEEKQRKRKSHYALKQKMKIEASHKRHNPPVHGCSLCKKEGRV